MSDELDAMFRHLDTLSPVRTSRGSSKNCPALTSTWIVCRNTCTSPKAATCATWFVQPPIITPGCCAGRTVSGRRFTTTAAPLALCASCEAR